MRSGKIQLPGKIIEDGVEQLASDIRALALAGEKAPEAAMMHWEPVSGVREALARVPPGDCYLFHQHPVHAYKNVLSRASWEETVSFMEEKIRPERGEGIDVLVAPDNFSGVIICNHDGEMFFARNDSKSVG